MENLRFNSSRNSGRQNLGRNSWKELGELNMLMLYNTRSCFNALFSSEYNTVTLMILVFISRTQIMCDYLLSDTLVRINLQKGSYSWIFKICNYLHRYGHQDLLPNGQVVPVRHPSPVEWHIKVVTQTCTVSDVVKVRLSQIRPKLAALVSMNRKVQHPKIIRL